MEVHFKSIDSLMHVVVDNGPGNTIFFNVSGVLTSRNSMVRDIDSFSLLNSYLQYKGKEFNDRLYSLLSESYLATFEAGVNTYNTETPTNIIKPIIEMLDIDDIKKYLTDIYRLKAPNTLLDVFEDNYIKDAKGTREQTYIKSDYIDLVSVVIIIKAIIGPLGYYATLKEGITQPKQKEFQLLNIIRFTSLYSSPPIIKLRSWIEKVLTVPTPNSTAEAAIRTIENFIPKSMYVDYLLGIITIQRLATVPVIHDTDKSNLITTIYNFSNVRLRPGGDTKDSIRAKSIGRGIEGDTESMFEAVRRAVDISAGEVETANWALQSVEFICFQFLDKENLPDSNDPIWDVARATAAKLQNKELNTAHINLLSVVSCRIINSNSLLQIRKEYILNLYIVAFVYLWNTGHKNIAGILMSVIDNTQSDNFTITSTTNRSRLTQELVEEIEKYYPLIRKISETNSHNIMVNRINDFATEMTTVKWVCLLPDEYKRDIMRDGSVISGDIKIQLAEFLIFMQKRYEEIDQKRRNNDQW